MKLPALRIGRRGRDRVRPPACIALSVCPDGADGVRVAYSRAEPKDGGAQWVQHGRGGLAQLGAWLAGGAFRDAQVVLVLESDQRQLVVVDRPAVPDTEMHDALRWPAAAALDMPAESLLFDAVDLPALSDGGKPQTMVVATTRERLQALRVPLDRLGLRLDAVDSVDMAQRNAVLLQAPAAAPTAAQIVVGRSAGELLVGLVAGGELCVARNLPLPTGFSRDGADPALVERLALHVQRAADLFERQITRFAIVGSCLFVDDFGAALGDAFRQVLPGPVRDLNLDALAPRERGAFPSPGAVRGVETAATDDAADAGLVRLAATARLRCQDALASAPHETASARRDAASAARRSVERVPASGLA